jgi:hypothetical protein
MARHHHNHAQPVTGAATPTKQMATAVMPSGIPLYTPR